MTPTLPTYDSSKVSSLSLSSSQQGATDPATNTWTDETFPFSPLGLLPRGPVGFAFDFSVRNDSERGLVLGPRIPFTSATDDPAGTGETATIWTLTIATTRTVIPTRPYTLYGVSSPAPEDFATGNTPTDIQNAGNSFTIATITSTSGHWVLNGSTYDLVFELDFLADYVEPASGVTLPSPLHTTVNNPLWNGVVQFILANSTSGTTTTITGATYAGNVHKWHTGATGFQMDRRARVVRDYKTSQHYLSDEAVEDGYLDGIMLNRDNFDPADPIEDNPYIPPPDEGVAVDDVISVE